MLRDGVTAIDGGCVHGPCNIGGDTPITVDDVLGFSTVIVDIADAMVWVAATHVWI